MEIMKFPYGKNVFLTGGSSGIGLATSELLAASGFRVFAASRNPPNENRSFPGGGEIRPVTLDVRDPQSIEMAAETVLSTADIGIVIHCAGVGIACAGEDFPPDAFTNLMETNYTGVLRVNNLFLPYLRRRGAGLCVIVGSVAGLFPVPFQSHYCASKAALDSYGAALRMELRNFRVRVSLVLPGDTKTGFTNARRYITDEASPYHEACIRAAKRMEEDEQSGYPAISVARVIKKLSSRKNPPVRTIVGLNYKLLGFIRRLFPDRLVEWVLRSIYLK